MTRAYAFKVDSEAESLCDQIIDEMVAGLGLTEAEAIGRLNRAWGGNDFRKQDIRYHETPEFWAKDIYFGPGSKWWTNPPGLTPKPFP